MNYKYLFFLLMTIYSCGGPTPKEEKEEPTDPLVREHNITFVRGELELPLEYMSIRSDDLRKHLLSKEDLVFDESLIQFIDVLNFAEADYQIFVDSTNYNNNIWMFKEEYGVFNKEDSGYILGNLQNDLVPYWTNNGYDVEKIESTFKKNKYIRIFKAKYSMTKDAYTKFMTFYLITTQKYTLTINVHNEYGEDFEQYLKNIRTF